MARKTVLVCDNCGREVGEGKGATLRLNYTDARRGSKQADLCGPDARPCRCAQRPQAEGGSCPQVGGLAFHAHSGLRLSPKQSGFSSRRTAGLR